MILSGKYEAWIAIFRILAAIDRFSRTSQKVESRWGKSESRQRNWKAVEEIGKPLKKIFLDFLEIGKQLKKIELWARKIGSYEMEISERLSSDPSWSNLDLDPSWRNLDLDASWSNLDLDPSRRNMDHGTWIWMLARSAILTLKITF